MKILVLFSIVIFLSSCFISCKSTYKNDLNVSDRSGNLLDSTKSIFPDSLPSKNAYFKVIDDFNERDMFNQILLKTKSPLLYNYYLNEDIYRLVILYSTKSPAVITLKSRNLKYYLDVKIFETPVFSPLEEKIRPELKAFRKMKTKFFVDTTILISKKDCRGCINLMDKIKFWELIAERKKLSIIDGTNYLIEAHTKSKYWAVFRSRPEEGFQKCCEYMINLTNLYLKRPYRLKFNG